MSLYQPEIEHMAEFERILQDKDHFSPKSAVDFFEISGENRGKVTAVVNGSIQG